MCPLIPGRVPSAAHWRSSCGLCSLWYIALLWFGGFLRLYVVRLVSAIMFDIISIIILISCIVLRICCINICFLVVVVDVSGPILVKNWLDSGETHSLQRKCVTVPPSAGWTGSFQFGTLLRRSVEFHLLATLHNARPDALPWRGNGCVFGGDCSDHIFTLGALLERCVS